MEFYIDTASLAEIEKIAKWGIISGVTTNPSIIAKERVDLANRVCEICDLVDGPVSAEVTSEDPQEMLEQGRDFAQWHKNVVVKLPCTEDGLSTCHALSKEGIKTNLTLCFSVNQALLCARAGASYVSIFIGRLEDIGQSGLEVIRQSKEVFIKHDIKTKIIAASIRTPQHITDAASLGGDIATIPPKLFPYLLEHPLTTRGQEIFLSDWQKAQAD